MKIKTVFSTMLFSLAAIVSAEEKIITETTFSSLENANTWYYLGPLPLFQQKDPKFQAHLSLEKEGDLTYLKVGGPFYIGYPLKKPVKVDDSLEKLEITVMVRNFKGANTIAIAASDEPVYCYAPFPRKGARDSGIMVTGYQYGNKNNFLLTRKEGVDNFCRPATAPVNLLGTKQNCQWVTWKLTLNHADRQLEFTRDGEKEPSLIQYGVDLSGVTLKHIYLKGACEYQWIKAVVTTK